MSDPVSAALLSAPRDEATPHGWSWKWHIGPGRAGDPHRGGFPKLRKARFSQEKGRLRRDLGGEGGRRQANLPAGVSLNIVALEKSGRVVIFEIKRDVDRRQPAQCLEYSGEL